MRIRTASWCHFIRNPSILRNPHLRAGLVADTKWWASLLETWTNAEDYRMRPDSGAVGGDTTSLLPLMVDGLG